MKYDVTIKKMPKSEVELSISLPSSLLVSARAKAIQMLSLSMDVPGFRKGHIPENIVLEKAGEAYILEEAADLLLKEHFAKIVEQEKLDIIGRPQISITKLALNNPLECKITCTLIPTFELPDYKKIAKKEISKKNDEVEVTEKEVDEVLLQIRKNKAHFDWHKANPDHKEHDHPDLEKEENLPVVDDVFAKEAGNFTNVSELKEKIKENIKQEKEIKNIEKKRALIMEELVNATPIDVPEILIESEIEKSLGQMKDSVTRMGITWEQYLANTKKSENDEDAMQKAEAEIRNDLKASSEKKAKIQLIFNKISEIEKLEIDQDILNNEVAEILKHYPDASEENAKIYVSTILLNAEVLKLLEGVNN